jgi:large subunit ribosomal protein L10
MPKTRIQKQEILRTLSNKISQSKSVVFARFDALGVKDNEELRKELKKENSEYYVAKKTLLDIAFKESRVNELNVKSFTGRIAAIFGYDDEVAPAKIIEKFKKGREGKVEFVGGILENKLLTAEQVDALSKIPSRQELYAKMVGSLNAPISGFVNVLAGNLRGLVCVLKAIEEKKK